jgi:sarcosine oxidase, subunit alpha
MFGVCYSRVTLTDDPRTLPTATPRAAPFTFDFEGSTTRAFEGESLAVALWAAGVRVLGRSTKFHRPRGAFCFEGHCASCYLRVDGRPNVRACMTVARPGLRCERQNAFPSAELDLLAAADWMFPDKMDHHHMMTGNRVANRLLVSVVRQMGGSGTLPDEAPASRPLPPRDELVDVCIVGAGPAGLAAAEAILTAAAPPPAVLVVDEQAQPGGSLLAEPGGAALAAAAAARARAAGARIVTSATAIGFFKEDPVAGERRPDAIGGALAVATPEGLLRVGARRILYATGGYDQNMSFLDNDRPGVISARACGRLAFAHGVHPGRRVAIVGPSPYGDRLAAGLAAAGVRPSWITRVDATLEQPVAASGATALGGLIVRGVGDAERRIRADVVAVAAMPAPASELARQHGAAAPFDQRRGGFAVVVDSDGRTSATGVSACGDATGYLGPIAAAASGTTAGRAISRGLAALLVLLGWLSFGALSVGCASAPPPAPAEPAPAPPPDPRLQPTFVPAPPVTAETRVDVRTRERREILDAVWTSVRDLHYDPSLGGLDWVAVRRRYEPLALAAPDDPAFYRALNDMIGEIGQSHMAVSGPGAEEATAPDPSASQKAPAAPPPSPPTGERPPGSVSGVGEPGLTIRSIDGRPTVTAVRPGSSAALHRIAPGFIVTRIGGQDPVAATAGARGAAAARRSLRPVEERFALRRQAVHLLQGPVGSKVTVEYLDNNDRPGQAILDRDLPPGPMRQIGYLPPLYPEVRVSELNGVGIIAFNMFLLDPLLNDIKQAVDRFRERHMRGVILDLRGNPGGLGAMAIPVASEFVATPITLGTIQFRTFAQTFTAQPSLGRTPFLGPLVILTDEGTASASEMLAAGLQESGRARVVGDTTLGAVLPSLVQALPHGAVLQVVVADFKTPKGILVEGRGVQPDRRVAENRASFRAGRDAVMDAALEVIKGASTRAAPGPVAPTPDRSKRPRSRP